MAIANLARPLTGGAGTGAQQHLPITGYTPPRGVQSADDYNKWLRTQPWYLDAMQAWGQNPNDPHLSPTQRAQVADALGRAGVLPQASGIDPNGNVEATGVPWWQWALLAAGPATLGITSVLSSGGSAASGLSAAGSGISDVAPAAGDLASTTIAPALGSLAPSVTPSLASAVAPAAATTGGTLASTGSWFTGPTAGLISTGLNIAGQIYSSNQQANTNADAARIQAQEYDKALAQAQQELDYQHGQNTYSQNQYAAYLSRLDPYAQTGQAANNALARYTGSPQAQTPLSPTLNQAPANPYTPIAGSQPQQQQSVQQSSASNFVPNAVQNSPTASQVPQVPGPYANWPILQAPDGSKRRVSPDKVQQALAAGAQMVNA